MTSSLRSEFAPDDLEIERSDKVFRGYFSLQRHTLRHRLFNGEWSETMTREVFYSGPAITVLPYDPKLDKVLLIEQFRVAAHLTNPTPWMIEVIAGRIDGNETPETAVIREAREEADISLSNLTLIASIHTAPGFADEVLHHYCAQADLSSAGGIHGLDNEQEDIKAIVTPLDKAIKAIEMGEINTGPAITSLYWLALNRERLKASWGG